MDLLTVPIAVLSDSYKAAHYEQYPSASKMVAYGEFRRGFNGDKEDTRIAFYGMRYIVEKYLHRQWTMDDLEAADKFFSTHNVGHTSFPYPRHLFLKFIQENDGYFPIKLEALPEGTAVYKHVPVYQITAQGEYAHLCTYLETLLTMVWYPTTVATLSRRARDVIGAAFERSVDGGRSNPLLLSRLHDFGFRGCTGLEQSVLGGVAHLLNFDGSDTMSAAYYAQFALNGGEPVAASVPATEHSVMMAWPNEREAIENLIERSGSGVFACVMDSYDYARALGEVLPAVAEKKLAKGGFMVLRPDSGDQVEAVLMALRAAEKVFGVDINSLGFKVPKGCSVIQGDAVTPTTLRSILDAVMDAGFSACAVAFGMGGGLLQKVNRDTMSFATKLSHIQYTPDGPGGSLGDAERRRDIMKAPVTDASKDSLPGILQVRRENGIPMVYPVGATEGAVGPFEGENMLQVVYDCGPVDCGWERFADVRKRLATEWESLPPVADVVSAPLRELMAECRKAHHALRS
eukprot:jgi/Mesvir1/19119/Mv12861-RA.1